jgi:signal transduction histidine kinase
MFNSLENEVQKLHTQTNLEILNIKHKIDKVIEEYERKIEDSRYDAIKAMVVTTSHDINQPLTILQFSVEMLRRKDMGMEFSPQQLEYLTIMEQSINRIKEILAKYNSQEYYEVSEYLENINMVKFDD